MEDLKLFFLQECINNYNDSCLPALSYCILNNLISNVKSNCSVLSGACHNSTLPYQGFCLKAINICIHPSSNFMLDDFFMDRQCLQIFQQSSDFYNSSDISFDSLSREEFNLLLFSFVIGCFILVSQYLNLDYNLEGGRFSDMLDSVNDRNNRNFRNNRNNHLSKKLLKSIKSLEKTSGELDMQVESLKKSIKNYDGNVADTPDEFTCPISFQIMDNPVKVKIASSKNFGDTYDKLSILKHFKFYGPSDPLTRRKLDMKILLDDDELKYKISKYQVQ